VAGIVASADSIDDLNVVRHVGTPLLFDGAYASSTPGESQRAFSDGLVRQLQAASREFQTARLPYAATAGRGHGHLHRRGLIAALGIRQTKTKVPGFGHTKIGGYQVLLRRQNPLVATISTPDAAPVIAVTPTACWERRLGPRRCLPGAGIGYQANLSSA
jgi:hypothetical protein